MPRRDRSRRRRLSIPPGVQVVIHRLSAGRLERGRAGHHHRPGDAVVSCNATVVCL